MSRVLGVGTRWSSGPYALLEGSGLADIGWDIGWDMGCGIVAAIYELYPGEM